jgi:hypothetical protein
MPAGRRRLPRARKPGGDCEGKQGMKLTRGEEWRPRGRQRLIAAAGRPRRKSLRGGSSQAGSTAVAMRGTLPAAIGRRWEVPGARKMQDKQWQQAARTRCRCAPHGRSNSRHIQAEDPNGKERRVMGNGAPSAVGGLADERQARTQHSFFDLRPGQYARENGTETSRRRVRRSRQLERACTGLAAAPCDGRPGLAPEQVVNLGEAMGWDSRARAAFRTALYASRDGIAN